MAFLLKLMFEGGHRVAHVLGIWVDHALESIARNNNGRNYLVPSLCRLDQFVVGGCT